MRAFQISQLIRLLIRDKQTNPFKYQTVLIGASRTYGSVFGFSFKRKYKARGFPCCHVSVCKHIVYCRHAFDGFGNQEQTHVQQIHTTIRLQYEQLKRFISFIPFFFSFVFFSLTFFLLPVFPLIACFTFCFVVLCYWDWLLFNYCSLKYYMPLCIVVVTMCVHMVSQFLSGEKKMRNK